MGLGPKHRCPTCPHGLPFPPPDKLLSARVYPETSHKAGLEPPGSTGLLFPPAGSSAARPWPSAGGLGRPGAGATARGGGEVDEETKKNQNIINIIREGQISLLVSTTSSWRQDLNRETDVVVIGHLIGSDVMNRPMSFSCVEIWSVEWCLRERGTSHHHQREALFSLNLGILKRLID